MIAAALALRPALSRLTPLGSIRPMNITFYFNNRLIRNLGPREFQLLISNEVVHQFTLPNIEWTSVHDRNNWLYDLEGQCESPSHPKIPPVYECHSLHLSDSPTLVSAARATSLNNHNFALDTLQTKVAAMRVDVTTIRQDLYGFIDIDNEQFDHLHQVVYSRRPFSDPTDHRSGWSLPDVTSFLPDTETLWTLLCLSVCVGGGIPFYAF